MDIGNFFEWNGSMPEPVWNAPKLNEKYNIEQNALFAATYLNPTEPLKFILGGRFTNYEKNIYGRSSSIKYDHEFVPYAGLSMISMMSILLMQVIPVFFSPKIKRL